MIDYSNTRDIQKRTTPKAAHSLEVDFDAQADLLARGEAVRVSRLAGMSSDGQPLNAAFANLNIPVILTERQQEHPLQGRA